MGKMARNGLILGDFPNITDQKITTAFWDTTGRFCCDMEAVPVDLFDRDCFCVS